LEPVKLTVWKVMIERVTVVKFRVNYRGGNGAGCFEVVLNPSIVALKKISNLRLNSRYLGLNSFPR